MSEWGGSDVAWRRWTSAALCGSQAGRDGLARMIAAPEVAASAAGGINRRVLVLTRAEARGGRRARVSRAGTRLERAFK